ncbi:MAG: CU044_2847 family protein [Bacteroidota bacterium]
MPDKQAQIIIHTDDGPIYLYGDIPHDPATKQLISNEGGRITAEVNQEMAKAFEGVISLFEGTKKIQEKLQPDELTIEAGVQFDLKTGVFFLTTGTGFQFKISLTWK